MSETTRLVSMIKKDLSEIKKTIFILKHSDSKKRLLASYKIVT